MLRKVLFGSVSIAAGSSLLYLTSDESSSSQLIVRVKSFAKPEYPKSSSHAPHSTEAFKELFPCGEWNPNWDFRAPREVLKKNPKYRDADEATKKEMLAENTPKAERNIYLIRHGQYFLDSQEKNLTPLGREQAALIGERLAASGIKFDHLTKSTMNRATETANIILDKMPELKKLVLYFMFFNRGRCTVPACPQAERLETGIFDGARIEASFRKYFHRADVKQKEDSHELIVCHANVIRYFVCRALQLPPEAWLRMSLGNCSITWIVIRPNGNVSARSIGDIGHFPRDKISFT